MQLLGGEVQERLGYAAGAKEVKSHPFFRGIGKLFFFFFFFNQPPAAQKRHDLLSFALDCIPSCCCCCCRCGQIGTRLAPRAWSPYGSLPFGRRLGHYCPATAAPLLLLTLLQLNWALSALLLPAAIGKAKSCWSLTRCWSLMLPLLL